MFALLTTQLNNLYNSGWNVLVFINNTLKSRLNLDFANRNLDFYSISNQKPENAKTTKTNPQSLYKILLGFVLYDHIF